MKTACVLQVERWPSWFLGRELSSTGVEDRREDLGGDSKLLMQQIGRCSTDGERRQ